VPAQDGRIYRKIAYGPLLDVFMLDMRSYRDSTWNKRDDQARPASLARRNWPG
jgi:alkaline phosphatase D